MINIVVRRRLSNSNIGIDHRLISIIPSREISKIETKTNTNKGLISSNKKIILITQGKISLETDKVNEVAEIREIGTINQINKEDDVL